MPLAGPILVLVALVGSAVVLLLAVPPWPALAALAFMSWLGSAMLLLDRWSRWRWAPVGEDRVSPDPAAWPRVTVIVPARNEADMLPRTLPALLAQDYPGELDVVIVDDRSEDATAGVATAIPAASTGSRVRVDVVRGSPLPDGSIGKPWAMQQGLRRAGILDGAQGDEDRWVLFTDADILHAPGSVRRLVSDAVAHGVDLDSRMARLPCEAPAERLLVPAFTWFFGLLYPFARVDESPVHAAAAGGCMLIRASILARTQGVEWISDCVIDDVNLARAVKLVGGRLRLAHSRSAVRSLRRYLRLSDTWSMVRRTAFTQLGRSWTRVIVSLHALVLAFVVPALALSCGVALAASGDLGLGLPLAGLGAGAWLLQSIAYLPAVRGLGAPGRWALALPLAGVLYGAMTLDSAIRQSGGRAEAWRGPAS